jgi:hypothetical protein
VQPQSLLPVVASMAGLSLGQLPFVRLALLALVLRRQPWPRLLHFAQLAPL